MRELRSVANALLIFAIFLVLYAFWVPGHARSGPGNPRFLKMQIDEREGQHSEKVSVAVPYFFVRCGLRFAGLAKIRRELDWRFDDSVEAALLKGVWTELSASPEGTTVEREHEGNHLRFRRIGEFVSLTIRKEDFPEPGRDEGTVPTEKTDDEKTAPPGRAGVTISLGDRGTGDRRAVTVRFPARIIQALVESGQNLDVEAVIGEIQRASRGDLFELQSPEAHVRVWLE